MNPTMTGGPLPNYRTARLMGVFNTVFASILMIFGLCMGAYIVLIPTFMKAMDQVQQKVEQEGEAERKQELAALTEAAEKATTDADKEAIEAKRKEVENRPKAQIPGMMDFNKMGLNDPKIMLYSWVEVITGLVLNVMLFVSGLGLLKYRSWARKLGVTTGWLKILRLVLVYGFFTLAIVPPMSQKLGEAVGEMMEQQTIAMGRKVKGTPPTDLLVKTYTIMYSAIGVGFIVIGSVYPLVSIWFLTRPRVAAACAPAVVKDQGVQDL